MATTVPGSDKYLIDDVPLLRSQDFRKPGMRWGRAANPLLRLLERQLPKWNLKNYQQTTGRDAPEAWEWYWVDQFWNSFSLAKAALSLRPRFVFGHEVTSYGLGTALCKGVPRVILPWGGDIFNCVESSPVVSKIATHALHNIDLILPASTVAAEHMLTRFDLPSTKVQSLSWGVKADQFQRANDKERQAICSQFEISPDATIILNCRRFNPLWGAFDALEACIELAKRFEKTHHIFLGGQGAGQHVATARARVAEAGVTSQFTLFDDDIPLEKCAELMGISDIFLSLLKRGDMRSASVLQATAAGGVPIIVDSPEYRAMTKQGFVAQFVPPQSAQSIVEVAVPLIENENQRAEIPRQNDVYIREHEDNYRQMTRMLTLINDLVDRYQKS